MRKIKMPLMAMLATVALINVTSCKTKPTPVPDNANEEINRVDVYFIKTIGAVVTTDTTKMYFNEAGTPSVASLSLIQNTTYKMLIVPSHNGVSAVDEIKTEGHEHQFFFFATPTNGVTNYVYNDKDKNNRGIGLDGNITFGAADHTLKIILRHSLDKASSAASTYNNTNYQAAGGEDDLNLVLPIKLVP